MELTNIQELTSFNSDKPTSESKLTLFPCQVEALVSGHLQDTKKDVHNWSWAAYKNCSCKRRWLHCFVNGVLIPVITKFQNVTECKRALKYDSVVHPLYIL